MNSWNFMDLTYIYFFILVGVAMVGGALTLSRLVAPHNPGKEKNEPYECGEIIEGLPWVKFNVRYYVFALLFLIFDVETVFLYPLAVSYQDLVSKIGYAALVEMFLFVFILFIGLLYPWRKGVLKWF